MTNLQDCCSPVEILFVDTMAKRKRRNKRRSLILIRGDGLTIMKVLVLLFVDGEGQKLPKVLWCLWGKKVVLVQA